MNATSYIRLLRPAQWLKNLMIFFPPFLGGTLFQLEAISSGMIAVSSFCFASSSTYIFNDIFDRKNDTSHPLKKNRPIPSGAVSIVAASVLSIVFSLISILLSLLISKVFCFLLLVYFGVQLLYTLKLKEKPIIDIFCVSASFLLRLEAGGQVYKLTISEWLFLSVFLLEVFLSTGKRLGEINFLGSSAGDHRKSLSAYPPGFLDGVLCMTGGAVMVTYTMFVITRHALVYTVPVCCFGLLRYIYRIKSGLSGDPTEALLKDGVLLWVSLLWAVMVWCGYYVS